MKPISTALAAAFVCLTLASPAWAEAITKKSSHGVPQTLDRLEHALKAKGLDKLTDAATGQGAQ